MRSVILLFAIALAGCTRDDTLPAPADTNIDYGALANDDTANGKSVTYEAPDDYLRHREAQSVQQSAARDAVEAVMEPSDEERASHRIADLEQRLEKLEREKRYRLTEIGK